jgi:uncharacterized protein YjdB
MKNFKYLLFLSILCSLVLFTNCGEDEDPVANTPTNTTDDNTDDGTTDPVNYTLTITASEGGTITPESGSFGENESVELLATPDSTYIFVNWTGSSSSTANPFSITMDSDKSYTANFVKKQYPLTVNIEGEGTVSEEILANGRVEDYDEGTIVKLTATAAEGWRFVTWVELDSTQNPLEVTITDSLTLTARFVKKQYPLTILTEGEGTVSEEIVSNGRVEDYDEGTVVKLTANPAEGWRFVTWIELESTQNPLEVTITDSLILTARFDVPVVSLSITPSSLKLAPGDLGILTSNILPSNATDTTVTWTSSNETIATIDQAGIVTAITAGETTITAVATNGGLEAVASVQVATPVTGLTISPQSKEMNIGSTVSFAASILPSNATDTTVAWTSSDVTIATIDQAGIVTAIAVGETTITAIANDGGLEAVASVTVLPTKVTGVTIDPTSIQIYLGSTGSLKANISPTNATDTTVTWTSSNETIATIDQSGVVTAIAVGEVTITAVTTDGAFEAVASATVLPISVTGLTIEPSALKILLGSTGSLTANVVPENATNKAITWTSDDTSIATIDENGLVTGVSIGNVIITGTSNDGSYNATSNIEIAEITSFIEVSLLVVSVSIINGNYSGTFGSTILNKSPVSIQLTQYEVYDGDTNVLKLLANKTDYPDLFPSISTNESHGLQSAFNSFIYKPIFKWSFEYEGAVYSVLFQAP